MKNMITSTQATKSMLILVQLKFKKVVHNITSGIIARDKPTEVAVTSPKSNLWRNPEKSNNIQPGNQSMINNGKTNHTDLAIANMSWRRAEKSYR